MHKMSKNVRLKEIGEDHYDVVVDDQYRYSVGLLNSGKFELSNREIKDFPKQGSYSSLSVLPVFLYEKREIGRVFERNQDWRW